MPKTNSFLFILPTDNYLIYPSCVMERFIRYANPKADKVVLKGGEANPDKIIEAIKSNDPKLIAGTGHGSPCVYTVQHLSRLIMVEDFINRCPKNLNLDVVKGRVLFLNSCDVGKELGREVIDYGAEAFLGSSDIFLFPIIDAPCTSFDVMAVFIAEYSGLKALLEGKTVKEAHQERIKAYEELINDYTVGNHRLSPNADLLVRTLRLDESIAVYYGNGNATVATPYTPTVTAPSVSKASVGIVALGLAGLYFLGKILKSRRGK